MTRRPFFLPSCLLVALLGIGAGCTPRPTEPAMVPVRGKIVDARKKPVGGIIVRFWPSPGHAASRDGVAQTDGAFELTCVPGKYEVTLMHIPGQHGGDPATGGTATPDKGKAPRTSIPASFLDAAKTPWRGIDVPAEGRTDLELVLGD